jgi:hypothetical protein
MATIGAASALLTSEWRDVAAVVANRARAVN